MVVDAAFALSVLGFLVMHARMVAVNATTIEMYEKRRDPHWRYNRGLGHNLQEVFGPRWDPLTMWGVGHLGIRLFPGPSWWDPLVQFGSP